LDQDEGIKNTLVLPQRVKTSSISGLALLSKGEEPCPFGLQTVFSTLDLILFLPFVITGKKMLTYLAGSLTEKDRGWYFYLRGIPE